MKNPPVLYKTSPLCFAMSDIRPSRRGGSTLCEPATHAASLTERASAGHSTRTAPYVGEVVSHRDDTY